MIWRVLLTVLYALAFGAVLALENSNPGMSEAPVLVVWGLGLAVGFAVGRWWVVLAGVGMVVGRTIGWDTAEHDGNPALWPPYVVSALILVGLPLLVGVGLSYAKTSRSRRFWGSV